MRPENVLEFWFGTHHDDAVVAKEKSALWWSKDAATDALMHERFAGYLEPALRGELDDWLETAEGRLALILVCDQFPRNIHRGTPLSFAYDEQARLLCRHGLEARIDVLLRPIERVFFYLPLEHSESLEDQHTSVAHFEALLRDLPADRRSDYQHYLDFARRHLEIIARFGRFPHRNAILGRASTAEEAAFLKEPGSSF